MELRHWQDKLEIGPRCVERFLTTERFSTLNRLQVSLAGVSYLRGQYFVSRRAPQEHLMVISMAGAGSLHTPQGQQRIGPNQVLLLPAGCYYSISLAGHFWRHNWLLFSADINWYKFPQQACVLPIESSHQIDQCLKLLLDEEAKPQADPLLEAGLSQLLKRYLLQLLKPLKTEAPHPLYHLEQQLRSSLHYPWSVADMAQRLSVSEAHCYRLFRQEYQLSPKQYLTRLRLEHAKYLLRESQWSIEVIASQLAYQDGFAFAHRFKKSFGISPGRYRRNAQAPP